VQAQPATDVLKNSPLYLASEFPRSTVSDRTCKDERRSRLA
jgi:hypothetical protein